jgi:FixJ family two-component response regulator
MPDIKPLVFIVDDDVSVRESLELLIRHEGWQAETYSTADDFLKRLPALVPSCLILDVSLPGISGLELQSRISEDRLAMPIIFITGHGDIPMTVRAMKAGAIEFLTKPLTDEALVAAVKQALEHSRTALADQRILLELQTHFSSLSPRERDVMALVVTGMLNKQVGAELGISEITVKAHRGRVMQKMKADSLADLVQIATKLGLHRLPTA